MSLVHFLTLSLTICISWGQFVPLGQHKLLKVKDEVPLHVDYQETLNDCPNKYFKYGGQTLISSLALDINKHHFMSHFVLLGEVPGLSDIGNDQPDLIAKFKAKCVGVLISNNWTLVDGNCMRDHKGLLSTIRTGVDRYGEWNKKSGNLTEVLRFVNHPSHTDFVLVESKDV